jgi:hypothetical protein
MEAIFLKRNLVSTRLHRGALHKTAIFGVLQLSWPIQTQDFVCASWQQLTFRVMSTLRMKKKGISHYMRRVVKYAADCTLSKSLYVGITNTWSAWWVGAWQEQNGKTHKVEQRSQLFQGVTCCCTALSEQSQALVRGCNVHVRSVLSWRKSVTELCNETECELRCKGQGEWEIRNVPQVGK